MSPPGGFYARIRVFRRSLDHKRLVFKELMIVWKTLKEVLESLRKLRLGMILFRWGILNKWNKCLWMTGRIQRYLRE